MSRYTLRSLLKPLGDDEVLVRNIYLSVEPAMRGWVSDVANYSEPVPLGSVMRALAVEGVFEHTADGCFAQTPLSQALTDDHPVCEWPNFAVDEIES